MDLNVKTPFFLTQGLHDALKVNATADRPAKVIVIASVDGFFVNPVESYSYHASKAGVLHLAKKMAMHLIKDHIVVSSIAPGAFPTDMNIAPRAITRSTTTSISRRGASAGLTTSQALRSFLPAARAITWSEPPSPSMAVCPGGTEAGHVRARRTLDGSATIVGLDRGRRRHSALFESAARVHGRCHGPAAHHDP